jgi:hypothetical protein
MNEPTTAIAEPQSAPPPPPEPTGAELRAEVAAILERDLLRRFTSAGPRERKLIETIAELAADLAHLTRMAKDADCDPRVASILIGGINRVARGLHMLGTDRIGGTFAEQILVAALAIEPATLAAMPAEGTA